MQNSWIIEGLDLIIFNITLSGYLYFMLALFGLAFVLTIIWYYRAVAAHKLVINFLHHIDLNIKNDHAHQNTSASKPAQVIELLNNWVSDRQQFKKKIIYRDLRNAWNSFHHHFTASEKYDEELIIPDIYDYFLEENLVYKHGKRRLVDVIPGVFVSLGILGTFVGLIAGLEGLTGPGGHFVSTDSDTILGGIGGLIGGMTVAFYSSIMGIILSLLWQFIDKTWFYPTLVSSFQQLRNELDRHIPTQAEESYLQQMIRQQIEMKIDFQRTMSEILIPRMVTGIKEVMEPHLEQMNEVVKQSLERSSQHQVEGMNDMVEHFVNSLNEITGDQMKHLGDALEKTVEWQEKVHQEMTQLVSSMQQAAQEQNRMIDHTINLTEQIHQYTDKITDYQSTLQSTIAELNETSDRNIRLHDSFSLLLDKMTIERTNFDQFFEKRMDQLKQHVEGINFQAERQSELLSQYEQLGMRVNQHLREMASSAEANQKLSVSLIDQAEKTTAINESLHSILDSFKEQGSQYQQLQEQLTFLLSKVQEEREKVTHLSQNVINWLDQEVKSLDESTEKLSQLWTGAYEKLSETNEHLSTSMDQFAEHMYRGLERTFDQFDRELSRAVQHLQHGIQAMEDVVVELPDGIEKLGHYVELLNEQAEKIIKEA